MARPSRAKPQRVESITPPKRRREEQPNDKPNTLKIPKSVEGKTPGQDAFLRALRKSDVTICDGVAGTGKTFLAVANAMERFRRGLTKRIIVCRPIVPTEDMGFLPGEMAEKAGPYMDPIYEAVRLFCGSDGEYKAAVNPTEGFVKLIPLAFMRGHTFRDADAILDEGQNASEKLLRLFLGRIHVGSRATIVGDSRQCDLPAGPTGFRKVFDRLSGGGFRNGIISTCTLGPEDIQRHGLIAEIEDRMTDDLYYQERQAS